MALINPFTGTEADAKEPINEDLTKKKYKENIEDLATQIDNISIGGGTEADLKELFAEVTAGGKNDVGVLWRRRFNPLINTLGNGNGEEGLDIEGKYRNDRFIVDPNFSITSTTSAGNVQSYLTMHYILEKTEKLQFRIKKGENFFAIGYIGSTLTSDNVEVYVDGVNANTYGLVDETGNTVPTGINTLQAAVIYGSVAHYFGLDGEEHIITVLNNDSASREINFNFVDVGYKTDDPALAHTVKVEKGKAKLRGTEVEFNKGSFTFTKPTEGLVNGYTGMLKINTQGTVTAVDGLSPAATQCKPNEEITFSSGPVTSLAVKNHFDFPDNGIGVWTHPTGENFLFSWASKGQSGGPQTQTLDGIIWQAQPQDNYTPLPPASGATYAINEFRGDARIEYWAKAPIEIDATNDKVDFRITNNGTQTTHAATIPAGFYSADLISLEKAFNDACQTVKPINGKYILEYNDKAKLWSIGVRGGEVTELEFLFSTGVNSTASFGPTVGFSLDLLADTNYLSTTELSHLAQRVFIQDANFMSTEDPRIKWSFGNLAVVDTERNELLARLGIPSYRYKSVIAQDFCTVYPDEDACGLTFLGLYDDLGAYITYCIDDGDQTYLLQTDRNTDTADPIMGSLRSAFISFPKGSKKISFKMENQVYMMVESNVPDFTCFGFRQWFTKPAWESLARDEQILDVFEVNPIQLYRTYYGHVGGLYIPQGSGDNINTLVESGTTAQVNLATGFNRDVRRVTVVGSYQEVDFTLVGDGGGVGFKIHQTTTSPQELALFVSDAAIVEGTDLMENISLDWASTIYARDHIMHLGLKAGTYKARIKLEHANTLDLLALAIYDTVPPEPETNNFTDLSNTGQGLAEPIHVRRVNSSRYASIKQPVWLPEERFNVGRVSMFNYETNSHVEVNPDDVAALANDDRLYWSTLILTNTGRYVQTAQFCRSIVHMGGHFSTSSAIATVDLDGIAHTSAISNREDVKGGLSPTSTRQETVRHYVKQFELAITHNASLTFNMGNTRGLREGQKVILIDNVNAEEEAFVTNIVNDTSFDIKQALSVITEANVVKILFPGFHNLKIVAGDANNLESHGFEYEPLPLEPSLIKKRVFRKGRLETKTVVYRDVQDNNDLGYPVHSDGVAGSWLTSSIQIVGFNLGTRVSSATFLGQFYARTDLKNLVFEREIGGGAGPPTAAYGLDIKITSTRMIYEDIDGMGAF